MTLLASHLTRSAKTYCCYIMGFLLYPFSVLFVGPLIPCFWTSGDISPWFQSHCGSPHLHAFSTACNGLLRFASVATPADLLMASMTAEPFRSTDIPLLYYEFPAVSSKIDKPPFIPFITYQFLG